MPDLGAASLIHEDRRTLERFADLLRDRFGDRLHAVWLYGSRARGEVPREDSDIDVMVIADGEWLEASEGVIDALWDAAEAEGSNFMRFSVEVWTPERLRSRREIKSFFIQEVDRDKVVVAGVR